jgi:hypothetical protein
MLLTPFGYQNVEIAVLGSIINFSCGIAKFSIGFVAGKHISFKNCLILI